MIIYIRDLLSQIADLHSVLFTVCLRGFRSAFFCLCFLCLSLTVLEPFIVGQLSRLVLLCFLPVCIHSCVPGIGGVRTIGGQPQSF